MSTKNLNSEVLTNAIKNSAAAFRCRRRLQPGGGAGDKVFPPTFAGAVYAEEQRRVPGRAESVTCVLLDSVQSQANRMELALQEAMDDGAIKLPLIAVDFGPHGPTGDLEADEKAGRLLDDIGRVTSLQAPHRLADAILRDSELNGMPFRKTDAGKSLNRASALSATPIFQFCPTALLFGMWDSTGPKGGLGAKFERAMVSEVVGFGAQVGSLLRGVRRDPLDIRAAVKVLKSADNQSWSVVSSDTKGSVAPSKVVHSNIPFPEHRDKKTEKNNYSGATIEFAEQISTLSLIALRRLRFPLDGKSDPKANAAGQAVLAALGLCAATLAFESGMGLRSRCLLWPEGPMEWELLAKPGAPTENFALDREAAIKLLNDAVSAASGIGLKWQTGPLVLQPSKELLKLVRLSQQQAVKSGVETEEE